MDSFGIYTITNKNSGHFYIGSSKNVKRRLMSHIASLNSNTHPSKILQLAYNVHPFMECDYIPAPDRVSAYTMEERAIKANRDNPLLCNFMHAGKRMSPESCERRSRKLRGRKLSQETIAKMKATFATMDRRLTPDQIEALRQRRLGTKHSETTKQKMSTTRKSLILTEHHCSRIAEGKMIPVVINGTVYPGSTVAAKELGTSKQTVLNRIRSSNPLFENWQFK